MNNIIQLNKTKNTDAETAFVALLDDYCHQENAVKPLNNSFFERIEKLKEKAAKAQQHDILLEA
jgi:hypothetical protein